MTLHTVRGNVLPADVLDLLSRPQGYLRLDDSSISIVLALLAGQGTSKPTLVKTDDLGNVQVGPQVLGVEGLAAQSALMTNALGYLWDGGGWDRARTSTQGVLNTVQSNGGAMVTPPGMWSIVSTPAAGLLATATRVAGGATTRHIASGMLISFGAIAAPVATQLQVNLRDGAAGVGTILASLQVAVPAAVFASIVLPISGLSIPGSLATAMTLEFSAGLANLIQGVTLCGYDAI